MDSFEDAWSRPASVGRRELGFAVTVAPDPVAGQSRTSPVHGDRDPESGGDAVPSSTTR